MLSALTWLNNQSPHPFPAYKTETILIKQFLISPTPTQPLATTVPSVSMNLTSLGTSCTLNHPLFVFRDWLISLSTMASGFSHAEAGVRMPFLFKEEQYSIVCIDRISFIHSSMGGHSVCSHFLMILLSRARRVRSWIVVQGQTIEEMGTEKFITHGS